MRRKRRARPHAGEIAKSPDLRSPVSVRSRGKLRIFPALGGGLIAPEPIGMQFAQAAPARERIDRRRKHVVRPDDSFTKVRTQLLLKGREHPLNAIEFVRQRRYEIFAAPRNILARKTRTVFHPHQREGAFRIGAQFAGRILEPE